MKRVHIKATVEFDVDLAKGESYDPQQISRDIRYHMGDVIVLADRGKDGKEYIMHRYAKNIRVSISSSSFGVENGFGVYCVDR